MYLVREQNNDLILLVTDEKPFKHNGSWKTKHNCQMVMLDKELHPEVQWIDCEPTECEIATVGNQQIEQPNYEQYVIRPNARVECPVLTDESDRPLMGGYYCRNCENNLQTFNDEETGNLIIKCRKKE